MVGGDVQLKVNFLHKVKSPKSSQVCPLNHAPLIQTPHGWLRSTRLSGSVICNLCNAVFSASQKQAIVLPRLKKSTLDRDYLTSYRPVSNLSFTSKVVEGIVASRFVRHAEDNHLFPSRQSSYGHGHSIETAMLSVYNDLVRAVDSKLVTALVLLDLSSAFDTVDHSTLLTVLDRRFGV